MLYRVVIILVTGVLLLINVRLYSGARAGDLDEQALKQLTYLEQALQGGAGEEMQGLFPEGFFFIHALYGLTWIELARHATGEPGLRERALLQARWALEQLESDEGRRVFNRTLDPPYGVFYAGWRTWLHGGMLAIQDPQAYDSTEVHRYVSACERLSMAFDRSETPFLPSYQGAAWPSDALVGIAALRLHDLLFEPRFEGTIAHWLAEAKSRLDPGTGLLPHEVDYQSGQATEGARGSSQALMLRFLFEVDPDFARAQYRRFRRSFVTTLGGLPGVREYPKGGSGTGDIDSGPVVFGLGAAATIVALGTARTYGDQALAEPLMQTIEALGFSWTWAGKKRYLFGQLPIGDAFLVWSKIARPVTASAPIATNTSIVKWWWRLPLHSGALLIVGLLWMPVFRRKFRTSRQKREEKEGRDGESQSGKS